MLLKTCLAAALLLGLAGCSSSAKLTPQQAAAATQMTTEMNAAAAAVANSRYRTYRWLSPEEMETHRLGYDPTLDPGTRYEVEQTVDDELVKMGYRQGDPADFTVAFSDIYLDPEPMTPLGIQIYRNPEERFTIAFFDARTGHVLWRGWGKEVLNGIRQSGEELVLAVNHALEDMPVPLVP
jgi:Domain of unknown function (DUF4136)